jgi:spermidine synthase
MLYQPVERDHFAWWTPYQQIEYTRTNDLMGNFFSGEVRVNHTGYQWIYDLSDGFIASHPKLLTESAQDNPYNLPFRFAAKSPTVLIVGSGTGNDLAAALRHDSRSVDAVEIDPAILELGRQEHPEHPYDSQKVSVHVTDARAFLKRTNRRYDLILFGLLDSHTQLSDYSNMRIDNFVYTEESFREARKLLTNDGVMFVKFQVDRPWLFRRLATMMKDVFGKSPIMFQAYSSYSTVATCFVISQSNRVENQLLADSDLSQFVARNLITPKKEYVPVTTDDWPYLYQEQKRIPGTFIAVGAMVLLLAAVLYLQVPEARQQLPAASFSFFFVMGAGFLLLETMVVSRLALYFGTTWQVNGIVISAMLVSLLASNAVIERSEAHQPRILIGLGLLGGLSVAYFLPYQKIPASATVVGILAAIVFAIPVFFAGLLFSNEFRVVGEPDRALGANMLGAVVGGLLENLSFIFGMRSLLLVSIALYSLAVACLLLNKRSVSVLSELELPA